MASATASSHYIDDFSFIFLERCLQFFNFNKTEIQSKRSKIIVIILFDIQFRAEKQTNVRRVPSEQLRANGRANKTATNFVPFISYLIIELN